uniref:Uncharacterized protein n=1 Tax=Rousettus aegyptiacus TaxID=9407 RepID=A0A7J8JGZ9_ROUAE|nr:hypothetical protein HJG63_010257 [Rousettus aegyptiacus]
MGVGFSKCRGLKKHLLLGHQGISFENLAEGGHFPSNNLDNRRIGGGVFILLAPSSHAIPSSTPRAGLPIGEKKIWFSKCLFPCPTLKPQNVEGKLVTFFFSCYKELKMHVCLSGIIFLCAWVCTCVHCVCKVTGVFPGMHGSLVSMHLMFFRMEG